MLTASLTSKCKQTIARFVRLSYSDILLDNHFFQLIFENVVKVGECKRSNPTKNKNIIFSWEKKYKFSQLIKQNDKNGWEIKRRASN